MRRNVQIWDPVQRHRSTDFAAYSSVEAPRLSLSSQMYLDQPQVGCCTSLATPTWSCARTASHFPSELWSAQTSDHTLHLGLTWARTCSRFCEPFATYCSLIQCFQTFMGIYSDNIDTPMFSYVSTWPSPDLKPSSLPPTFCKMPGHLQQQAPESCDHRRQPCGSAEASTPSNWIDSVCRWRSSEWGGWDGDMEDDPATPYTNVIKCLYQQAGFEKIVILDLCT